MFDLFANRPNFEKKSVDYTTITIGVNEKEMASDIAKLINVYNVNDYTIYGNGDGSYSVSFKIPVQYLAQVKGLLGIHDEPKEAKVPVK